jgi:hypothetical protein
VAFEKLPDAILELVHVLVTHADPFPVQEESQALQFA